jgi:hypothetical protein
VLWKKALSALAVCASAALVVCFSPRASAEIIDLLPGNRVEVGNLVFSDFYVDSELIPPSGLGSAPGPDAIDVTVEQRGDQYVMKFAAPWLAGSGTIARTTIGYKVSVDPAAVGQYWIDEGSMGLVNANVLSGDGGYVSVSETIHDTPPPSNDPFELSVYVAGSDWALPTKGVDSMDFPGMPTEFWVNNGILLLGADGLVQMTEFEQTFSQQLVPEPGSFALLGFALLGLCVYRWRRRRQAETPLGNAV